MGDDGETRYVMIDSQMANPNSKFAAPTVFNQDVNFNDFIDVVYRTQGQQTRPVRLRLQRYYESQVIRLYAYHGSAVRPSPVVLDISQQTVPTRGGGRTQIRAFNEGYQTFETLEKAKSYVAENESAILGGIGSLPREQVDALKHYRLIKTHKQNSGSYIRDVRRAKQLTGASFNVFRNAPSWVKTFEKVPGATVDGTGAPPGDQIRATVRMRIPSNGRTFSYTQYATADENGDFEMTLPYSTTGYENFGPENGYTNVSVRATSDYRFVAGQQAVGSAEVSEAQVVGVDDSPVQVELSQPTRISRQSIQATG
jgi:dolichyl-diphosphooligosaccharide--protein glycosyltransferase